MPDHGFAVSPVTVRAEFFTDDNRLKWKYTDALNMEGLWDFMQPHHAVAVAWQRLGHYLDGYVAVVFDPYHRFSYPIMLNDRQRVALVADAACYWDLSVKTPVKLA